MSKWLLNIHSGLSDFYLRNSETRRYKMQKSCIYTKRLLLLLSIYLVLYSFFIEHNVSEKNGIQETKRNGVVSDHPLPPAYYSLLNKSGANFSSLWDSVYWISIWLICYFVGVLGEILHEPSGFPSKCDWLSWQTILDRWLNLYQHGSSTKINMYLFELQMSFWPIWPQCWNCSLLIILISLEVFSKFRTTP